MPALACFVSAHGFGHAARVAAVAEALSRRVPRLDLHLFTETPSWFFADSRPHLDDLGSWVHHPTRTDVGLIQRTSLEEDGAATADALDGLLPFPEALVDRLASQVLSSGCGAVLCDIAPLGIEVARRAGVPSVLQENFTWDWIYRAYLAAEPRLAAHSERLAAIVDRADLHLQVEPPCHPRDDVLHVAPVARPPRSTRARVRDALAVPPGSPLVLVTMGGFPWHYAFLERLESCAGVCFVIPGGARRAERRGSLRLLPERSGHYHPDLVAAADVVVGKLGYSTLAEVAATGGRLLYVPRPVFPESPVLARWAPRVSTTAEIDAATFAAGDWLGPLDDLLGRSPAPPGPGGGADQIAALLAELLHR